MSTRNYAPRSGRIRDESGNVVNRVDLLSMLGGVKPISGKIHDINAYAAGGGDIIGEDGLEYNEVTLILNLINRIGSMEGNSDFPGANGWTPEWTAEEDGGRRVLYISDWTGGTGTKPQTGYISASGLVDDIALAMNFRGPAGKDGGSVTDYNDLQNIPVINGLPLTGDISLDSLGLKCLSNAEIIKILQEEWEDA